MDESQPAFFAQSTPVRTYSPPADSTTNDNGYYSPNMEQPLVESGIYQGERPKNFPPCKPILHHDIKNDIIQDKRMFIRKAYVGWWFHSICLFWNFIAEFGGIVQSYTAITDFVLAITYLILGPPISFFVYWLLYSAMRKNSAFNYVLWFFFFFLQIAAEIIFALGFGGGAGFLKMLKIFSSNQTILGIFFAVSFVLWTVVAIYNIFFLLVARKQYSALGGAKASTKEFGKAAANTAYENRGAIKQVVVENKDAIKQFAVDHKEDIKQFAVDNKDEIKQFAVDNREAVARVAYDNKDMIWENHDVVSSVFHENNKV